MKFDSFSSSTIFWNLKLNLNNVVILIEQIMRRKRWSECLLFFDFLLVGLDDILRTFMEMNRLRLW